MISQDKLLPFRDYDEHEVVNLFALDGLAKAGTLVKVSVSNPSDDDFATQTIGASYNGVTSYRWVVKNKVAVAPSGSTKFDVLGLLLHDVAEVDENGQPLIYKKDKLKEMGVTLSGEATPVLRRGLVTLLSNAYTNPPQPNWVGVPAHEGNGKVTFVSPGALSLTPASGGWTINSIVGKCISTSGTKHGGYALFLVDLP